MNALLQPAVYGWVVERGVTGYGDYNGLKRSAIPTDTKQE